MENPLNFDDFAEVYDATINWTARLANEEPLLRKLIEQTHARTVLDSACGTGRHAQMIHSWGNLTVHAADLSEAMLAIARRRIPESPTLRYFLRSFTEPLAPTYELILCTGNSLSLPGSLGEVSLAVKSLMGALKPGGVLLVQTLNLQSLPIGPSKWQRCGFVQLNEKKVLAVKGIHRTVDQGHIDVLLLDPEKGSLIHSRTASFLKLTPDFLSGEAMAAGASSVEFHGDYALNPCNPEKSNDLIMIARR